MKWYYSFLLIACQTILAGEPFSNKYTWITVINQTGAPIKLSYFRPDPGFRGPHVIVQDTQELAPDCGAQLMITRLKITAPRCVYQFPQDNGSYNEHRVDSHEVALDLALDEQIITVRQSTTKSAAKR